MSKLNSRVTVLVATMAAALSSLAQAGGVPTLGVVEVQGGGENLIGAADSANQGTVLKDQLENRPVYRPAELLETTPGLIVTQHSGEGKANQYFLRGFNLDHGTDLRTSVDGMLVNQRSHGHGQGWTDLNFFIPELTRDLQYKKGPYYADEGDFASAGAVSVNYVDKLSANIADASLGQNGYRRALIANSGALHNGTVLYALEWMHNDGPWANPDDYTKINGVARYSQGDSQKGFNLSAMAYEGKWNSTDQIPKRAVDAGTLSRLGTVDPTDGGAAKRYSVSGAWHELTEDSTTHANAYVIYNDLKLFSNFEYFVKPEGNQFGQPDQRVTSALNADHTRFGKMAGYEVENTFGVQFQHDNIFNGLQDTAARNVVNTVRDDHIRETSLAIYAQNSTRWLEKFRTVAGLRADHYRFDIDSNIAVNSGKKTSTLVSPKLSMVFGPWADTEYYVNAGGGYHSNDARGTTLTVDPTDPTAAAESVTALVRSKGYEVGVRTAIVPGLQTTLAIYRLDIDSELLFLGDAGTTEASRPSQRTGFELSNFYKPNSWLTLDIDYAYARARFSDDAPEGDHIPNAVRGVASIGATAANLGPWSAGVRARYFGSRPLIEDGSVESSSTSLVNAQVSYRLLKNLELSGEIVNIFDSQDSAIDYYYESQLKGEASPVADIHFHPIEGRTLRVGATATF